MKSNAPDVSIVIPNFNCLAFLPKCLDSIRAQRGISFEIIVIDDGSSDGSLAWLAAQARDTTDLRVFAEKGLGAGGARNLGVQVAKAPLIGFLDADDWWYEGKLASQIAFHHANPEVVLSFSDYDHFREADGQYLIGCYEYWPLFKRIAAQAGGHEAETRYRVLARPCATLYAENVVGTSTVVVRRDAFLAVQGFDTSLRSASDWDLWLKLSQVGSVGYTCERTMGYLMREGSISRDQSKRLLAMAVIMARHAQAAADQDGASIAHSHARLARGYQEFHRSRRERVRAVVAALKAFYYMPSRPQLMSIASDLLTLMRLRVAQG